MVISPGNLGCFWGRARAGRPRHEWTKGTWRGEATDTDGTAVVRVLRLMRVVTFQRPRTGLRVRPGGFYIFPNINVKKNVGR